MTTLIIQKPIAQGLQKAIRFGGIPSAPNSNQFEWPRCSCCKGFMQFICEAPLDHSQLALVFMCQNNPGLCDEWDPNQGGNTIKVVPADGLEIVQVPKEGNTLLPFEILTYLLPFAGSYEDALRTKDLSNFVLGKFGGDPDWVQAEETPICDTCGQSMKFVAQMEQGNDGYTEINFGGGLAFLFDCPCGSNQAKFLWQC